MPRVPWDEHIWMDASAPDLPPLLVIQAGPGLPIRNERRRYRKLLALDHHFSVFFWDRTGTGLHPPTSAGLSLDGHLQETVDLLERIARISRRKVTLLGVSSGGFERFFQQMGTLADTIDTTSPPYIPGFPKMQAAATEHRMQFLPDFDWPES